MTKTETFKCLQCDKPADMPLHPGCSRLWVSARENEQPEAMRHKVKVHNAVIGVARDLLKDRGLRR